MATKKVKVKVSMVTETVVNKGIVQAIVEKPSKFAEIKHQIGIGGIQIMKAERRFINDIIQTGRLSYGKYHKQFEESFAKVHEVKFAHFTNSGTSALQVAIHALKIKYGYKNGDEIIAPALTFVASINTILQNNLIPVLVDVDPKYYEIDETKIEAAITPKTKAIMVVHIGGLPCNMEAIKSIADKHKLQIIEDSCETMFVKFKGKPVGSWGDVSCFSTYIAHILTTGVGGFACTNDEELSVLMKSLMNHGRDNIYMSIDDDNTEDKKKLKMIVEKRFNFIHQGYSYRATEFEAAIGLAQMLRWPANLKRRRAIAQRYQKELPAKYNTNQPRMNAGHAYMFYPIVTTVEKRDKLMNYLEEKGIETRYLLPLITQPIYKGLFNPKDYPVAEKLEKTAFYIPCHPALTENEVNYIITSFKQFEGGV